jgi:hypothetical protein
MAIDLQTNGAICPNYYTLKPAHMGSEYTLRNWELQGSIDRKKWDVLTRHKDDTQLILEKDHVSWPISNCTTFYKHLRVATIEGLHQQSPEFYNFFGLSGIEIFGVVRAPDLYILQQYDL